MQELLAVVLFSLLGGTTVNVGGEAALQVDVLLLAVMRGEDEGGVNSFLTDPSWRGCTPDSNYWDVCGGLSIRICNFPRTFGFCAAMDATHEVLKGEHQITLECWFDRTNTSSQFGTNLCPFLLLSTEIVQIALFFFFYFFTFPVSYTHLTLPTKRIV